MGIWLTARHAYVNVGFEVITAVVLQILVLWYVTRVDW